MRRCSHTRAVGPLVAIAVLTALALPFGAGGASASRGGASQRAGVGNGAHTQGPARGGAYRLHPPSAASASAARAAASRVARYWTPARMRSARPLDAPRGEARAGGGFARASFMRVPDATVPPFAVSGRVFLRLRGKRGFCSGTAIDSPTRTLVLTAAHCLNSGPLPHSRRTIWIRSIEFVPAYRNGVAPFGAFVARRGKIFVPRPFVKSANPDYDVGAFLTFPNAEGVNLADAVGGVAIALGRARAQSFQTFGYPAKRSSLQQCSSPYVGDDVRTYPLGGPPTIAIRCRWTPGASGGGWLIDEGAAINGLTSYGHRGDRRHTFGPYFAGANVGRLVGGL
jgi:hypothetical protein